MMNLTKIFYIVCIFMSIDCYAVQVTPHCGSIFDKEAKVYGCDLKFKENILTRNVFVNQVTADGVNYAVFNTLFIADQKIHFLPDGLDGFFSHILSLKVVRTELKVIHQNDLEPFKKLKFLRISQNQVEFLEENLFKFNRYLQEIYLNQNKIKTIASNVFVGLELTFLDLTNNVCIKGFPNSLNQWFEAINRDCLPMSLEREMDEMRTKLQIIQDVEMTIKNNLKDKIYPKINQMLRDLTKNINDVKTLQSKSKESEIFLRHDVSSVKNLLNSNVSEINSKIQDLELKIGNLTINFPRHYDKEIIEINRETLFLCLIILVALLLTFATCFLLINSFKNCGKNQIIPEPMELTEISHCSFDDLHIKNQLTKKDENYSNHQLISEDIQPSDAIKEPEVDYKNVWEVQNDDELYLEVELNFENVKNAVDEEKGLPIYSTVDMTKKRDRK